MSHLIDHFGAASLLGINPDRVRAMVRAGEVPYVALPGGVVRFDADELRRWVNGLMVRPAVEQRSGLPNRG